MRGSTLIWGILHYPLHLCLLLVFQAVNYNVEAVAVLEALEGLIDTGGSAVGELAAFYFASSNVTVDQLLELTLTSTNGTYLNAFAHNLGVNRTAALELGAYMANGNTTKFFQWTGANTAQLYTRLFAIARFPPTVSLLNPAAVVSTDQIKGGDIHFVRPTWRVRFRFARRLVRCLFRRYC